MHKYMFFERKPSPKEIPEIEKKLDAINQFGQELIEANPDWDENPEGFRVVRILKELRDLERDVTGEILMTQKQLRDMGYVRIPYKPTNNNTDTETLHFLLYLAESNRTAASLRKDRTGFYWMPKTQMQ